MISMCELTASKSVSSRLKIALDGRWFRICKMVIELELSGQCMEVWDTVVIVFAL
jgi:hypothetical protein